MCPSHSYILKISFQPIKFAFQEQHWSIASHQKVSAFQDPTLSLKSNEPKFQSSISGLQFDFKSIQNHFHFPFHVISRVIGDPLNTSQSICQPPTSLLLRFPLECSLEIHVEKVNVQIQELRLARTMGIHIIHISVLKWCCTDGTLAQVEYEHEFSLTAWCQMLQE